MRIGIDATCWSNPRGYGRYVRGLLPALLASSSSHEFILFVDEHTHINQQWPMPKGATYVIVATQEAPTEAASAQGRRSLRDIWAMSRAVQGTKLDVLFYPSVYSYFPALTQAQVLLGIHDVIAENYPQLIFPTRQERLLWSLKGWLARWQADYLVTVSDYAKAGIVERFAWPSERVWIVGEGPDPLFQPLRDSVLFAYREAIARVLARYGLNHDDRFIICLGGLNPHKNLEMLLTVLADLRQDEQFADIQLVLVGPAQSDTFTPGAQTCVQLVASLGLKQAVHFTEYLPDREVVSLLNAAQVLVMPSFEEGFGLGAVEAAACGTPIIATRNSPLPRLLEGGGLFIDPHQPEELRTALIELLGNETSRLKKAQRALEQARKLTWQRAAEQFLSLLDAIERS